MKFILMFQVLSAIYFFGFMVSMLFYLGAIQWLVIKMGWLLQVQILNNTFLSLGRCETSIVS